jgi:serine/threonine protein kinase
MTNDVDIGGDTLPSPVCDERTGTDVGNYTLQERLGAGGMAAVYRAIHRGFDEIVAVKLLAPRFGAQPEMLRRFLREAVVMREISARNNHVVRCLDFGQTATGEAYLVMDYLTGQDLQQLLTTVGPLSWQHVVPLALQLCDALATTHAHGIIHRDIKPSNCLLTEEDGEQRLKLIDFGVAKDLDPAAGDHTDANLVLGTPSYLAPELLTGAAPPDARSDIYAVGATLYCLLTGHPPYVGRVHRAIAERQQHEDLLPPSQGRPAELPRVPPAADALILRALDLDPNRRHQSAMDLADELRHSLEPHPSTRQLAGRALAMRTAWFSALAASLVVVFSIGAGTVAPRPQLAPFVSTGVALAEPTRPTGPIPPDPSDTATTPVPADSQAAAAPPPAWRPEPPVPSDTPPVPSDTTPVPVPVPAEAPPPPVPADPPSSQPSPPAEAPPPSPPAPAASADDPPVDPRTQRVHRILAKQREVIRRECRDLSGGATRLRFTLTLARGALEAVAAQPGTFRECVRSTLRDIKFGVDGQYPYAFNAG